ncbi:MAG: hypothetical protein ACLFQP_08625 [Halothece sp.]
MMQVMDSISTFFVEAIARIFSASDDVYPNSGVQPYSGDPIESHVELES